MSRAQAISTKFNSPADAMLHALPHPVIMVSPDGKIADANVAAEQFFEASIPMLRRHNLRDLVPFGSPVLSLIDQVRRTGAPVNEYKVDLATPRNPGERLVDLHVAALPEYPDGRVEPLCAVYHRRCHAGIVDAMKQGIRKVTDALVAKHGGRLVKTTGDGVLLEFPSVVDAVECAVAVQAVMAERNQGVPEDPAHAASDRDQSR